MYESQIVETEDMSFTHYINHFDEYEDNYLTYSDIYENTTSTIEYEDEFDCEDL